VKKKVKLSLISVIGGIVTLTIYAYLVYDAHPNYRFEWAFTWYLPFILASIFGFIGGIFTLLGKHELWAVNGIVLTTAAVAFRLILAWMNAMAGG
jgi:hypothetical protein